MVSSLASKNHKTMHHNETDETMVRCLFELNTRDSIASSTNQQIPIFTTETNGKPRKQKFIMGRRNWCQVNYENDEWVFDIRVEKEKGMGQTVGYSVRTPPPRWIAS